MEYRKKRRGIDEVRMKKCTNIEQQSVRSIHVMAMPNLSSVYSERLPCVQRPVVVVCRTHQQVVVHSGQPNHVQNSSSPTTVSNNTVHTRFTKQLAFNKEQTDLQTLLVV